MGTTKRPSIGVMISTHGDPRLLRTLHSIKTQLLAPGDDVLVVGDGYHGWTHSLVKSFGPPFRYIWTKRTKDWGHSQMNVAIAQVRGDYINVMDHDDIYAPRAFEVIREGILLAPDRPIMARVKMPTESGWGILWRSPSEPPFTGQCLLAPNIKNKVGRYGLDYCGDQQYIERTLRSWQKVGWYDKVITLTRPAWKLWAYPINLALGPHDWAWEFFDEGQTRKVGTLTMWRAPCDDEMVMYARWDPDETERSAWREITEFMLWAAQEKLYFMHQSDEQEQFLYAMGFRKDTADTAVSYWPPEEKEWTCESCSTEVPS